MAVLMLLKDPAENGSASVFTRTTLASMYQPYIHIVPDRFAEDDQVRSWIRHAVTTKNSCGISTIRRIPSIQELRSTTTARRQTQITFVNSLRVCHIHHRDGTSMECQQPTTNAATSTSVRQNHTDAVTMDIASTYPAHTVATAILVTRATRTRPEDVWTLMSVIPI